MQNPQIIEYRITRLDLYPPGTDLSTMEGHYVRASNGMEAATKAQDRFPGESVKVVFWKRISWGSLSRAL